MKTFDLLTFNAFNLKRLYQNRSKKAHINLLLNLSIAAYVLKIYIVWILHQVIDWFQHSNHCMLHKRQFTFIPTNVSVNLTYI